ncbi:LysR family transcriptional regulator [Arthrobacter bambusae]
MDYELRHLRAFVAVAKVHSYTAASRDLLITQPALTRAVQQLEVALGIQLLTRTSRSVELTAAGSEFYDKVLSIVAELDRAVLSIQGRQELRIGFQWVLPAPWATHTISEFERATGVATRLLRRDDVEPHLERGELDVAVTRTMLKSADLEHALLFDEERVAVVSSSSKLAGRRTLSWQELADHPLVINTVNGTTQPELWPPETRPGCIVPCENFDEWLHLVAAGRGLGALPRSAARSTQHPDLIFIPLVDAPAVPVWLAYQPRRRNALVRKFVSIGLNVGALEGK